MKKVDAGRAQVKAWPIVPERVCHPHSCPPDHDVAKCGTAGGCSTQHGGTKARQCQPQYHGHYTDQNAVSCGGSRIATSDDDPPGQERHRRCDRSLPWTDEVSEIDAEFGFCVCGQGVPFGQFLGHFPSHFHG